MGLRPRALFGSSSSQIIMGRGVTDLRIPALSWLGLCGLFVVLGGGPSPMRKPIELATGLAGEKICTADVARDGLCYQCGGAADSLAAMLACGLLLLVLVAAPSLLDAVLEASIKETNRIESSVVFRDRFASRGKMPIQVLSENDVSGPSRMR